MKKWWFARTLYLAALLLSAGTILVVVVFLSADRPVIKDVKIEPGRTPGTEWMRQLQTRKIRAIRVFSDALSTTFTDDPRKIAMITQAFLDSREVEERQHVRYEKKIVFFFTDSAGGDDQLWVQCNIHRQWGVVYGKGWASGELYRLICKDSDFDFSFFADAPPTASGKANSWH